MATAIDFEPFNQIEDSKKLAIPYAGPFYQQLTLNRPLIDRFLAIASLDGTFVIDELKPTKERVQPDINSDGSTTNKKSLFLLQDGKITSEKPKISKPGEYKLEVPSSTILEKLMERENLEARKVPQLFAQEFNKLLYDGLFDAVGEDKTSTSRDPYLIGRAIPSTILIACVTEGLLKGNPEIIGPIAFLQAYFAIHNYKFRNPFDKKPEVAEDPLDFFTFNYMNFYRKTLERKLELLSLPVEIDRMLIAQGYLNWHRFIKREPIVGVLN